MHTGLQGRIGELVDGRYECGGGGAQKLPLGLNTQPSLTSCNSCKTLGCLQISDDGPALSKSNACSLSTSRKTYVWQAELQKQASNTWYPHIYGQCDQV